MSKQSIVTLLILESIILIVAEPSNYWADAGLAALAGLTMAIAVRIIFRAIDRAGRE